MPLDLEMRIAAFSWLRERVRFNDNVFEGTELNRGFDFQGKRITLKGMRGIWIPQGYEIPISITTALDGPYRLDSGVQDDGLFTYAYYGNDPNHRDNLGLREASRTRTPLIYFKGVTGNRYQAIWPVVILQDNPESLCVRAAMDPAYADLQHDADTLAIPYSPLDLRRYAWTQTRQRLHQSAFREMVIEAYDRRCAICRLNHPELLDAAHIVPDTDDTGIPVVQNGLSLCKIHHAAYDKEIIGIDPDYHVHVSDSILQEHDGPMLKYGLQELEGSSLILPGHVRDYPDRDRLAQRFNRWRAAG